MKVFMVDRGITIDIGDLCTSCGRDTSTALSIKDANDEWVTARTSRADVKLGLKDVSRENDVTIHVTARGYICPDCLVEQRELYGINV